MQRAVVGEALKIKIDINNNPIIKNVCIDMRIKFPTVNIILPNSGKGLCTWVRDKDYPIVAKKGPINDNLLSPKSLKNQECSCIVKFSPSGTKSRITTVFSSSWVSAFAPIILTWLCFKKFLAAISATSSKTNGKKE